MAGTYGGPGQNTYPIAGRKGPNPKRIYEYSNVVNAKTGVTQIYQREFSSTGAVKNTSIGTYNPATKKFTPDANANLSTNDIKILSSQGSINAITNAAVTTATKAGASPTVAKQLIAGTIPTIVTPGSASAGAGGGNGGSDPASVQDSSGSGSIFGNLRDTQDVLDSFDPILSSIADSPTIAAVEPDSSGVKGVVTYPINFPKNMDHILFEEVTYGGRTFDSKTFTFADRKLDPSGNKVMLPIQTGISDANTVGWNEEAFNPAQVAGAQLAVGAITKGPGEFLNQAQNIADKMRNASTEIEKAIIAYFTEQAVGVQVVSKLGGAVFNPNTELLFQGPQLRSFNFSFRFTPREKTEGDRVKQILRFFKSTMAARTTVSGLFLKAPKVFNIQYIHGGTGKDHSGISKIKTCALQACNVDYTPDGSYMSFFDGAMVSYTMNLQFMELEPLYAKDYKDNHPIGY